MKTFRKIAEDKLRKAVDQLKAKGIEYQITIGSENEERKTLYTENVEEAIKTANEVVNEKGGFVELLRWDDVPYVETWHFRQGIKHNDDTIEQESIVLSFDLTEPRYEAAKIEIEGTPAY